MATTYQTKVYVHFKYGKDLELELGQKGNQDPSNFSIPLNNYQNFRS